jgi:hypothetical protein
MRSSELSRESYWDGMGLRPTGGDEQHVGLNTSLCSICGASLDLNFLPCWLAPMLSRFSLGFPRMNPFDSRLIPCDPFLIEERRADIKWGAE